MLNNRYVCVNRGITIALENKSVMKRLSALSIFCILFTKVVLAQSPVLVDGLYTDQNGNPFTGTATIQDASAKRQYIEVKQGLLHGQTKYFHPTGYLEEVGQYTSGKKDGVWIQFASNGQKLGEAYYNNGHKDGIWTVWDEKGIKRYHMVYSMGKKVDTWKMWNENAELVSERFYAE